MSGLQKHFLRSRWLDHVLWMEGRAGSARDRYYALRLTTVIGGVIVPAAAVEEFFHYGERWLHCRRTAEWLKIEGWQFFQLSGPYRPDKSHSKAYPAFAGRVEDIIQRDVEVYVTEVVREKRGRERGAGNAVSTDEWREDSRLLP